jgi:peptidoglycan/xylan/chitin deacetylase (PgdA/CDA1 family)
MPETMRSLIRITDRILSRSYLRFFGEKNSLIIFYFHGVLRDQSEMDLNVIHPLSHGGITIEHFRQLVEYFLSHHYLYVSPDDVLTGLNDHQKYIMISFDDGYFNNQNVLPVLREYQIPAVFFISSNHVKNGKCFWWDIVYRERMKSRTQVRKITQEIEYLKMQRAEEVDQYILREFGKKSLNPIGDMDRPFTPAELKNFSCEKNVFLGNHTNDHAILTNYSEEEIKAKILEGQTDIYTITGRTTKIISYPSGMVSLEIIRISKELGMRLGVTVFPKKNYLPINIQGNGSMALGRFYLTGNHHDFVRQCEMARSDVTVNNLIRRKFREFE